MRWSNEFLAGVRAGIPIGIGYLAVSLAVGLYWAQAGFTPITSIIFSATNMSSTGEFAAIKVMVARGGLVELALTTLLVNIRYVLMSVSLSQRLPRSVGTPGRLLVALGVTDEIYAVNISRSNLTVGHYLGSYILPLIGWCGGTYLGALVGEVIPPSLEAAAGILLYAMFIAIIIPPIMGNSRVAIVAGIAAGVSIILAYAPGVCALAFGWRVIISTLVASGAGATFFPVTGNSTSGKETEASEGQTRRFNERRGCDTNKDRTNHSSASGAELGSHTNACEGGL